MGVFFVNQDVKLGIRDFCLAQEQARIPSDAFGGSTKFFQGAVLNLADPLFANAEQVADLAEAVCAVAGQAEPQIEDFPFAWSQVFHQEAEGFLSFGIRPLDLAVVVGHRLGQFEIAVVVEHGIQRDRSTSGGLEVGQVLKTAARSRRKFLRTWEMFSAVGECFGFLLEEAEFLEVVRREADEMALAGNGDLECLSNPPGRVGGEPCAVADVKTIDGLHQSANGFLQQVGIPEGVMTEPLGDVGSETDVGRSEAMFAVDIAIVNSSNAGDFSSRPVAKVPDELRHGPGFHRWPLTSQFWEVANQRLDQIRLALPKRRQKFLFFFWREEIGREYRCRRELGGFLRFRLAFSSFGSCVHDHPSPLMISLLDGTCI